MTDNVKKKTRIFFWVNIIVILFLTKSFIFDLSFVPTSSMYPSIVPGDLLLITKYDYGYNGYSFSPFHIPFFKKKCFEKNINQGDIVTFRLENKIIPYVKRVIGLPGQKVQFVDGYLLIDDIAVEKSIKKEFIGDDNQHYCQYLEKLTNGLEYNIVEKKFLSELDKDFFYNTDPFYVPKDSYFLLGDNRHSSQDSRFIGYINKCAINAKAKYIVCCFKFSLVNIKRIFKNIYKI